MNSKGDLSWHEDMQFLWRIKKEVVAMSRTITDVASVEIRNESIHQPASSYDQY